MKLVMSTSIHIVLRRFNKYEVLGYEYSLM
jgi:hypothetical protein